MKSNLLDVRGYGPLCSDPLPLSALVATYKEFLLVDLVEPSEFGIIVPREGDSCSSEGATIGSVKEGLLLLSLEEIVGKVAQKPERNECLELYVIFGDDPEDKIGDGVVRWDIFTQEELDAGQLPIFLH